MPRALSLAFLALQFYQAPRLSIRIDAESAPACTGAVFSNLDFLKAFYEEMHMKCARLAQHAVLTCNASSTTMHLQLALNFLIKGDEGAGQWIDR